MQSSPNRLWERGISGLKSPLRGGRSPKVSLGFTYIVVCLGFIEDCFRVYLGLVYLIFFRDYFELV